MNASAEAPVSHPIPAWLNDRRLTGPFISGNGQRVYAFGQSPLEDEEGRPLQSRAGSSALKTRSSGPAPASDSSGAILRALPVSLADLIGAGLIQPGPDVLSVVYKNSTYNAELLPDGTIRYDGKAYNSASAFSIFVKRLVTPDKQGDDGWKSVLYAGKPLDVYRRQLRETMSEAVDQSSSDQEEETGAEGDSEDGEEQGGAPTARSPPTKKARRSNLPLTGRRPGSEPVTSTQEEKEAWVHCDGCGTWRALPDAATAAALDRQGEDAPWKCADATWDVTKYPPGTEPCSTKS